MIPFLIGLLTCLGAFFRSRYNLGLWSHVLVIVKPETLVRLAFGHRGHGLTLPTPLSPAPVNVQAQLEELHQLREAFPESCPYRYAILDRDGKFGEEATDLLTASGLRPKRITPASPWQNGVAERWIGSCRRDLLDHILLFNEAHLCRLVKDYLC